MLSYHSCTYSVQCNMYYKYTIRHIYNIYERCYMKVCIVRYRHIKVCNIAKCTEICMMYAYKYIWSKCIKILMQINLG